MKRFFVIFLMFALGLTVLAGAEKSAKDLSKEAKKILKEADKLREKKSFDEALAKYEEVINMEPDFALPYFFKGAILNYQKKVKEAIDSYEKGLQLMPGNKQAQLDYLQLLLDYAQGLMQEGDLEEANNIYLKALKIQNLEKTQVKLYRSLIYQVADNYSRLSNFDAALQYLDQLLQIPNLEKENNDLFVNAHLVYGVIYSGKEEIAKSNDYLQKFLQLINNDKYSPYYPFAIYYIGANSYSVLDKEIQEFNKKIQKINEEIDALSNDTKIKEPEKKKKEKEIADRMAELKKAKKEQALKHKEIETYLKEAIELQPQIEQAYVYLGNFYFYCEDFDNAIKYYQLLINNFPSSSDIGQYKKFLEIIKKSQERSLQAASKK